MQLKVNSTHQITNPFEKNLSQVFFPWPNSISRSSAQSNIDPLQRFLTERETSWECCSIIDMEKGLSARLYWTDERGSFDDPYWVLNVEEDKKCLYIFYTFCLYCLQVCWHIVHCNGLDCNRYIVLTPLLISFYKAIDH